MTILPTSSPSSSSLREDPDDISSPFIASTGRESTRTSRSNFSTTNRRRSRRKGSFSLKYSTYFKRLMSIPQMDFELALWQMVYLIVSPKRVYRNVYYHRQTKNYWARDDPAFHILLALSMCIASIAYGILWTKSFFGVLNLILHTIMVEFLFAGVIVASIAWFLTNKFMLQHQIHAVESTVEWMYCFDVHCNAFVPFFLITYVIQFFFLALILGMRESIVSRVLGNTIYLVAGSYYWYITFLGYSALPFLKNTIWLLYPIGLSFILYVISLFTFSMSQFVFGLYFDT